jgi:O-antigen/teichoic acid export membrane protein
MFLARPLLHIYGVQYLPLANLVVILAILLGVSGPCRVGGILLSSVGKQQRAVWISLGQLVLYITLFSLLWPKWQLAGGVCAYGLSMFVQGPLLMIVAWKSVPFRLGMLKSYLMFCAVSLISVVVIYFSGPLPFVFGLLAWAIAMGLFLIAAGYRLAECRSLLKCFLPVS